LTGLVNHLISRLDAVTNLADDLTGQQELPRALSDIAIFKGAMDGLVTKMRQAPPTPTSIPNDDQVNGVIEELKQSIENGSQS